jgi:hypothetical protein
VLILFFGALALGRFSVVGVRDAALAQEVLGGGPADAYPAGQSPDDTVYPATGQFPAQGSQFPAPGSQYPQEQAGQPTEQYPTTASPFGTPPADTGPLRGPDN